MGKVSKGIRCSVEGCEEVAERSVSRDRVAKVGFKVPPGRSRIYLCKRHWKEYKKLTRKERMIERWIWKGRST